MGKSDSTRPSQPKKPVWCLEQFHCRQEMGGNLQMLQSPASTFTQVDPNTELLVNQVAQVV